MPFPFKGEPLIGKSNYIEWKTKADLYLEVNSYIPYINRAKLKLNKALYYKAIKEKNDGDDKPYSLETAIKYAEKLSEYEDNSNKALGAIKSILSTENIERFRNIKDTISLYQAIISTFGSTSFE
jgi:hypothetical protein